MRPIRQRRAWLLVAIAALTIASLARVQAGLESARTYAHPVLEFLVAEHNAAHAALPRFARAYARSEADAGRSILHDTDGGAWLAMLPVLFVGLVAPLSLLAPRSALCLGRPPAAPPLPFRFQRPPPHRA